MLLAPIAAGTDELQEILQQAGLTAEDWAVIQKSRSPATLALWHRAPDQSGRGQQEGISYEDVTVICRHERRITSGRCRQMRRRTVRACGMRV